MKNILFLDDDIFIIKAYKRKLRTLNANIFYTSTTLEATELLKSESIDILFIDLNLEECTGIEFMDNNLTIIPEEIYLVTGANYTIEKNNSLINDIIFKPINYTKVIDLILN